MLPYYFAILWTLLTTVLVSEKTKPQQHNPTALNLNAKAQSFHPDGFLENLGQIADQHGQPNRSVKYLYSDRKGFQLQLRANGFSFQKSTATTRTETSESTGNPETTRTVHSHRIDVELSGANPNPLIIAQNQREGHFNYYHAHTGESGVNQVRHFSQITYRDIYPQIDLVFKRIESAQSLSGYLPSGVKYEFVVRPGGDPASIKLKYNGSTPTITPEGHLSTPTEQGNILEKAPIAFTSGGEAIAAAYQIKGAEVAYRISPYDPTQTLTIDPETFHTRKIGTYFGGTGSNEEDRSFGMAVDGSRELYITGKTNASTNSNIATTGTFQTSYGDQSDAFVAKFSEDLKTRRWATYYGGDKVDEGMDLAVSSDKEVYLLGYTASTSGIASTSAYQTTYGGGNSDLFIARLKSDGTRQWGTYYGGSQSDGKVAAEQLVYGAITFRNDKIYVVSSTESDNLSTTGAHQASRKAEADGLIIKFDKDGSRNWATYLGSNNDDGLMGVCTDDNDNIYVCGYAYNSDANIHTSGSYQATYNSNGDGILVKFNKDGTRQWGTYYGGSSEDKITGVAFGNNKVYIAGFTKSSSDIASSGVHQTTRSGNSDGFLVKLTSDGTSRDWGTYFGGTTDDKISDLVFDLEKNIVVCGITNSTDGIIKSGAQAFQTSNGGGGFFDAFAAKFKEDGNLIWSTYYGVSSDDFGYDIVSDAKGYIAVNGVTRSSTDMATTGAFDPTYNSSDDAFIAKFCDMIIKFDISDQVVWQGNNATFKVEVIGTKDPNNSTTFTYEWYKDGSSSPLTNGDKYDGVNTATLTIKNAQPTTDEGKYYVKVYSFCNPKVNNSGGITSNMPKLTVRKKPDDLVLCHGVSGTMSFPDLSGVTYTWSPADWLNQTTGNSVTVTPNVTGTANVTKEYTITIKETGKPDDIAKVKVTGKPLPISNAGADVAYCSGGSASLGTTSTAGHTYSWSPSTNLSSATVSNPTVTLTNTTASPITQTYTVTTTREGCSTTDQVVVTVYPIPIPAFDLDASICSKQGTNTVTLSATHTPAGLTISSYLWQITAGTGFATLSNANSQNATLTLNDNQAANNSPSDQTISVRLQLTSTPGSCVKDITKNITLKWRPKAGFTIPNSVCRGNIQPTNASQPANSAVSYQWSITPTTFVTIQNGTTSNPTFVFAENTNVTAIVHTVKLITTRDGCTDEYTQPITHYPRPGVNFTGETSGCGSKNITFTNTSNPKNGENISSMTFKWFVDGSEKASTQSFSYDFINTDVVDKTFAVKLEGKTQHGCVRDTTINIVIKPKPKADFTATNLTGCAPFAIGGANINLTPYSSANSTYTWLLTKEDGTTVTTTGETPPTYTINAANKTAKIKLTVTSPHGCADDVLERTFTTQAASTADFLMSSSTICSGETINFTNNSTGTGFSSSWDFGNGQTSATKNPSGIVFTNTSHTTDQTFTIKLTVRIGDCETFTTKQLTVKPKPSINFSFPTPICPQTSVTPTQSSSFKGTNPTYLWSATSGVIISNTSAEKPNFTFPDKEGSGEDTYQITLSITADGCSEEETKDVKVKQRPKAACTIAASSCGGTIQPTNTSQFASQYEWSVNPTIAISDVNAQTPTFTFPVNTGSADVSYTITLKAKNASNCEHTTTATHRVKPTPTASFTADKTLGCEEVTVNFTNTSLSNATSYKWLVDNTEVATSKDLSQKFTNSGTSKLTYKVKLETKTADNCSKTSQETEITVHPKPKAEFSWTKDLSCPPLDVSSQIIAIEYPDANHEYKWKITKEDGTVQNSTGKSFPTGIQVTGGNKQVTVELTVTSSHGCSTNVFSHVFKTSTSPTASFIVTGDNDCAPASMSLDGSATTPSTAVLEWYKDGVLIGTGKTLTHVFENLSNDTDKTYSILLKAKVGDCVDEISKTVTVKPKPKSSFTFDPVCSGSQNAKPDNNSTGVGLTYLWTITSSNASQVTISDHTLKEPEFDFPDFEDGIDRTYSLQLKVTSSAGCTDNKIVDVKVVSRPKAQFTIATKTCGDSSKIKPTNLSEHGSRYLWTVPTGVTISDDDAFEPELTFPTNTGSSKIPYEIKLKVFRASQGIECEDEYSQTIEVMPLPDVAFVPSRTQGCYRFNSKMTNNTVANNSEAISSMSFKWYIDGIFKTDSLSPTFLLENSGTSDRTFRVSLVGTTQYGCVDSAFQILTAKPRPKSEFSAIDKMKCAPFAIGGSNITVQPYPDANTSYQWRILKSDKVTLIQTFTPTPTPSTFNYTINNQDDSVWVELIASNTFGCAVDVYSEQFRTIKNPKAEFDYTPQNGCSDLIVSFTNRSENAVSNRWLADNIQKSTEENPQLILQNPSFTADADIKVKLIVTAGTGCKDSIEKTIKVYPKPKADFIAQNTCPGTQEFTSHGQAKGTPSYLWSCNGATLADADKATVKITFPDNQSGVDQNFSIKLTVTTADGCSSTVDKPIVVYSRPKANFEMSQNACGESLIPTKNLTARGQTYQWSAPTGFSFSPSASAFEPTITVPENNTNNSITYSIKLITTSAESCKDTVEKEITVYPKPKADFTLNRSDSCIRLTAIATNTSDAKNGEPFTSMRFVWKVNSDSVSNAINFQGTFVNNSTKDSVIELSLLAYSQHGCLDSKPQSITLYPRPKSEFSPTTQLECRPFEITDQILKLKKYPDANDSYSWYVNGIAQGSGENFGSYTIQNPNDSITVMLITKNTHDCTPDTMKKVFKTMPDPVADFEIEQDTLCTPAQFKMKFTGSDATSYEWLVLETGQTSQQKDPIFNLDNTGVGTMKVYTIRVIALTGTGCRDTSDQQKVYVKPLPTLVLTKLIEKCVNDASFQLTYSSNRTGSIIWYHPLLPTNVLTSGGLFDPAKAGVGTHKIYATFTEDGPSPQCSKTDSIQIVVHPIPRPDFEIRNSYCVGEKVAFKNTTPELVGYSIQYMWFYGDGVSNSLGEHTYTQAGDTVWVALIAKSSAGCSDTIRKFTEIVASPEAKFTKSLNPVDSCGPLTVTYTNQSFGKYLSYDWDFGNGQTSNLRNPSPVVYQPHPTKDTLYFVKLKIKNACGESELGDTILVKPIPIAYFVMERDTTCSEYPLKFFNYSTPSPKVTGRPIWFEMDFGDGSPLFTTSDTGFITHKFYYTGQTDTSYFITLKAYNECGVSIRNDTIVVIPNIVKAFFGVDKNSGCQPLTVNAQANQSVPNNKSFAYWFINGVLERSGMIMRNPSIVKPSFLFADTGSYEIRLRIVNDCHIDEYAQTIKVTISPQASFISDDSVCIGESVKIVNTSNSKIANRWDFGDGSTFLGTNPPAKQYAKTGTYKIKLYIEHDLNRCTSVFEKDVYVLARPEPNFDFVQEPFCEDLTFQIVDKSKFAGSVRYDIPSLAHRTTERNPKITFGQAGTYDIIQTAYRTVDQTDTMGCPNVLTKQIAINRTPELSIIRDSTYDCGVWTYKLTNDTDFPANLNEGKVELLNYRRENGLPAVYAGRGDSIKVKFRSYCDRDTVHKLVFRSESTVGCISLNSIEIPIKRDTIVDFDKIIPNKPIMFTPFNRDGRNDLLRFRIFEIEKRIIYYEMKIMARWGEQLFGSTDRSQGWDGTYRGKTMPTGVYYAIISYQVCNCDQGNTVELAPIKTIVREIMLND